MNLAKTAEPIEMTFGAYTHVCLKNHTGILDGCVCTYGRQLANTIERAVATV